MKIGLMHISPYSKADPAIIAKRAEELGFESYWVGDHTVVPVTSTMEYPGAKSLRAIGAQFAGMRAKTRQDAMTAGQNAGAQMLVILATGVFDRAGTRGGDDHPNQIGDRYPVGAGTQSHSRRKTNSYSG